MNVIERLIGSVFGQVEGMSGTRHEAEQLALYTAMIALRGGKAFADEAYADVQAWVKEHGPPDRAKLDLWAAALDVEAGIALAALKHLHPEADKAAAGRG
jgi:hypothetical protein